ncbi:MAG: SpoIIIAH-like family protein [Clostridiaceae bacterium]|nr:SpoIIIAH-like family protein [Eubacteriales bacterium]
MKNWKKYLTLGVVALLLVGAVYVNIKLSSGSTDALSQGENGEASGGGGADIDIMGGTRDYFEEFRAGRDSAYALELKYLEDIIATSASDAETLADVQEAKLALVSNIDKEFTMESLIKAKGYDDVAVMIKHGSVDVVVKAAVLEPTQVAQILSIVMEETGVSALDVNIIPYG